MEQGKISAPDLFRTIKEDDLKMFGKVYDLTLNDVREKFPDMQESTLRQAAYALTLENPQFRSERTDVLKAFDDKHPITEEYSEAAKETLALAIRFLKRSK